MNNNEAVIIKKQLNIFDLVEKLNLYPSKSGYIFSIYKEERTPSLLLYRDTNSFYCFATGKGGDLIDFYMDYYKVDFKTAIIGLSKMISLNINNCFDTKNYNKIHYSSICSTPSAERDFMVSLKSQTYIC